MDLGLRGKRALLLAATRGLGRAAANALAAEGASVAISSSNQQRCDETAAAITQAHGVKAVGIAADMFRPTEMDRLFERSAAALGGIDILFVNHGGPKLGAAKDLDPDDLHAQFDLVVASPIRLMLRVLPGMRARRWGRIVSTGGAGMVQALPNKAMDNTLRPALVGFSKALANEIAADGVTVNMILPGTFLTERVHDSTASNAAMWGVSVDDAFKRRIEGIPAGRFGELHEFGALVAFLCGEPASYINGSIVRVDGSQVRSNA
jgi:3-oxoacyl-[acyl-carrier protein] reductase